MRLLAVCVIVLSLPALVAGVVLGSIAAISDASEAYDPVIPDGARVAGLEVGGRPLSVAATMIESAFAVRLRKPIHVRVAGHRRTLTAKALRLRFDPLRSARRANIAARDALARGESPAAVNVEPWVHWSRKRLRRFVGRVEKVVARPARNARLRLAVTRLRIRPARAGHGIDRGRLRRRLRDVLVTPSARRTLRVERRTVKPKVTVADVRRRHPVVVTVHRRGFRLRVFKHGDLVASYPVAVGMPGHATPRGRFRIANKAKHPAWAAPDEPWAGAYRNEVVEGGARNNPLKARWLGIVNGVGIHGTDATWSLGHAASHGCIRMSVPAVKRVYELVPVGARVLVK